VMKAESQSLVVENIPLPQNWLLVWNVNCNWFCIKTLFSKL
jgi:hypothetical protein